MASVAFGPDVERRADLLRGLTAVRLEHVARLGGPESSDWLLRRCFMDTFWMTLHGFGSADSILVKESAGRFAWAFAAISLADRTIKPNIVVQASFAYTSDGPQDFAEQLKQLNIDVQGITQLTIEVSDPISFLAAGYQGSLYLAHRPEPEVRRLREGMTRLDLFHAALIAEWFFLRFGVREGTLDDQDYDLILGLARVLLDIAPDGTGPRLERAFKTLARVLECYGPILTHIHASRGGSRLCYLKSRKLTGLANLFSACCKKAKAQEN
jgi:hypothetical protein